jgi:hypothetical protein
MPRGMTERETDAVERSMRMGLARLPIREYRITRMPIGIRLEGEDTVKLFGFLNPATARGEWMFRLEILLPPIEIGDEEQWRRVREWLASFEPMVMREEP